MKLVKISNNNAPDRALNVKICKSFLDQFTGLMFTNPIKMDYGILLCQARESRIDSSIHMFFMKYDICVLWLNKKYVVVDKTIAKKWHPAYFPNTPAQYVLECHVALYSDFNIGDQIIIQNEI